MKGLAWFLLAIGCALLFWAAYDEAEWTSHAAERIKVVSDAQHDRSKVESDELNIRNCELDEEIARRRHVKYDRRPLLIARAELQGDRLVADLTRQTLLMQPAKDSTSETIKALAGAFLFLVAAILFCVPTRKPDAVAV